MFVEYRILLFVYGADSLRAIHAYKFKLNERTVDIIVGFTTFSTPTPCISHTLHYRGNRLTIYIGEIS